MSFTSCFFYYICKDIFTNAAVTTIDKPVHTNTLPSSFLIRFLSSSHSLNVGIEDFLKNDYFFKRLQGHTLVSFRNTENAPPLLWAIVLCGYGNLPQDRTIIFSTRCASQVGLRAVSGEKPEKM